MFLRCGHSLHVECFNSYIKSNYACPLCRKSIIDMKRMEAHFDAQIAATIMPEEYRNSYMTVLCNDCQHKSVVKFHILGGKCDECRSYNTSRIGDDLVNRPEPA